MNRSIKTERYLLIVLILLAVALRFADLGHKCFWTDEAFSYEVCEGQRYDDTTPMLFYNLTKPFLHLPFSPEINSRILPAFFGVMTVLVMFVIARNLVSVEYAFIAGILTAVNPVLIGLSQELRAYGMLTFLIALLALALVRLIKISLENNGLTYKNSYIWLIFFIVSAVGGLYTHYIMIPALAFTVLLFIFALLIKLIRIRDLKYLVLSYFLIGIAFAPHLPIFMQRFFHHAPNVSHSIFNLFNMQVLIKALWGLNLGYLFKISWITNPGFLLHNPFNALLFITSTFLIALLIVGFFRSMKSQPLLQLLPAAYVLFSLMYLFTEISDYRQLAPVTIISILMLSYGIYSCSKWRRHLAVALAVITILGSLIWYYSFPYPPQFPADFKGAARYLQEKVQPGEVVFAAISDMEFLALDFYYDGDVIPIDEQVKLCHTSDKYTKRRHETRKSMQEKSLIQINNIFSQHDDLYVIFSFLSFGLFERMGDYREVSSQDFGGFLIIKKYSNL